MRILFVADFRSPIAQGWIEQVAALGHDVSVVSTYPFRSDARHAVPARVVDITLARLWNHRADSRDAVNSPPGARGFDALVAGIRNAPATRRRAMLIKQLLMRVSLRGHVRELQAIIRDFEPDIIHALRIPFEGIFSALAIRNLETHFVVSIWGNDLTLIAPERASTARYTKVALRRANALITDCQRDLRLAIDWGFSDKLPTAVLPTSGGIDTRVFHPGPASPSLAEQLRVTAGSQVVVNPRGYRNYVCQEAFIHALPAVIERIPKLIVLAVGLKDFPSISQLVDRLGIGPHLRLLPIVPQEELGDVFRLATVSVSPSLHDGTPNSLLEAMATGCVPVAGDIESIREWITDGHNGLLCDPQDPASQANAMIRALTDSELNHRAREHNLRLVANRAERREVMAAANAMYEQVARSTSH